VASNLECVGMGVADPDGLGALIDSIRVQTVTIGRKAGIEVVRWQDTSGARLVLGIADDGIHDLLPSLDSEIQTRLMTVRRANDDIATAAVVDEKGHPLTSAAFEVEQNRLLPERPIEEASAAIVCLGRDMTIHATPKEFGESAASLLDPQADAASDPPERAAAHGLKWPPRMAPKSFISYGVFGSASEAGATARLAGLVVSSDVRTNAATGQRFVVATVDTGLLEVAVCLSGSEHPSAPEPGQVVAGTGYLVASIPELEGSRRRRWWWRGG